MVPVQSESKSDQVEFLDLSGNTRLPVYERMLRGMSHAEDAQSVLSTYMDELANLYENGGDFVHVSTKGLRPGRFRVLRTVAEPKTGPDSLRDVAEVEGTAPVLKGGLFATIAKTSEPKILHRLALDEEPVTGMDLSGYQSLVAFPLYDSGTIGGWIIIFFSEPEGASVEGLEETMVHGNLATTVAAGIRTANHLRETQAQIDREVEQIAAIQRALIPDRMPDIPGLSMDAAYETFDRAGGDYYDFLPYDIDPETGEPRLWAFVIADASGHGPAAAVVVAMLHALLHSYKGIPESPAAFLEYLNENLSSQRIGGAFVTAWLGLYEPATRTFRYASAGHEVPILMDTRDGKAILTRLEEPNGFPLGIVDRVGSKEATIELHVGQTVVLYTDGITEAHNPDRVQFQIDGVENALRTCNGEPDCVTLEVLDALREHECGARPQDDQTLVAIRVVG